MGTHTATGTLQIIVAIEIEFSRWRQVSIVHLGFEVASRAALDWP